MFLAYAKAMLREWVLWLFFGLDAIGLVIFYAPLITKRPWEVAIPPTVFWLLPLIGVYWAGHRVYASIPKVDDPTIRHRERDQQVFKELTKVLPSSGSIRWLRDYDFGGAFRLSWLEDLHRFIEKCTDPGFEFIDADLERRRLALLAKITDLTHLIGLETFPVARAGEEDMVSRIQPEMSNKDPARFREIQDRINALADDAVEAFDELVRQARRVL